MPEFLLVGTRVCPWVQRVAIVLREKNAPFEIQHVHRASSKDRYPEWVYSVSPLGRVPVLRLDNQVSLFESGAIIEYLDEVIEPQLHPTEPIRRAINRAWMDNVSNFFQAANGGAYVGSQEEFDAWLGKMPRAFEALEHALIDNSGGPYFNGVDFSLVDCTYAPFLQRYFFIDRIKPLSIIENYPRLSAWAEAVLARPTVHSEPAVQYEMAFRQGLATWNPWFATFINRASPLA